MKNYTRNTTFGEIFETPLFAGWRHMLDHRRNNYDDSLDNLDFESMKSVLHGWNSTRMLDGCNYLLECARKRQVFFSYRNPIEKANDPSMQMTGLAAFPLEKKSKFAVICPGGGYGAVCSMLEGYPLAKELNEKGYAAFVISYRVGKTSSCPAPQEDLAAAVTFILQHAEKFHLETEDYAVIGFSAGAHLAGSLGIASIGYQKYHLPKPSIIILGYPVITMGEMTHTGSRNNFLGNAHTNDKHLQELYSLEKQVTSDYPRTFVWQCDGDDMVPIENSKLFADALKSNGVPHCYEVFHYNTHGLWEDADEYAKSWLNRAIDFWSDSSSL